MRFVQKLNGNALGNLTDLGSFLFGRERSLLESYRPILLEVQAGRCFYCHTDLQRRMDVDHFVPWSRYPTDLGHNFVLSHPSCNNAKSDHLAAEEHLAAWIERNKAHAAEMDARLAEAELPHDFAASVRIAEWAYEQTEQANGQVWVSQGRVSSTWDRSGGGCWWRDCHEGTIHTKTTRTWQIQNVRRQYARLSSVHFPWSKLEKWQRSRRKE